jgi:iron complex outermembrane receptor protein
MKRIHLILFSIVVCQTSYAQLSGKLETSTHDPVPFANVLLLSAIDSSLTKGTLTNESGEYHIDDIPKGDFLLRFSAVGFTTFTTGRFSFPLSERESAKTFMMSEDLMQLDEVVVRGEKPLYEQQIDRTVVNVESSIMTKGSSALQVLERSPGVFIDMRNSTISMNGKNGVMVMLNGKIIRMPMTDLIAMLNGTTANDIEKIELITTPPAKYDADGTAGLINIVMKRKDGMGTTGSMSLSGGYGWGEKGTASMSIGYGSSRVNTFASYSFVHDRMSDGWDAVSTQDMPLFGGPLYVTAGSHQKSTFNNQNISAGIDLLLKKTTIGTSVNYNGSLYDKDLSTYGNYLIIETDSLQSMDNSIASKGNWHNVASNIFLEQQLRSNEKINFDLDYVRYSGNSPTNGITTFTDRNGNEVIPDGEIFSQEQRGTSKSTINVSVFKIDYSRQINSIFKVETGVKGTRTTSSSLSSISTLAEGKWTTTERYTNDTDMHETIGAAYSSLSAQLNPSTSIVGGLRYEHSSTQSKAKKEENRIDRELGMFFPSLFISRKMNDHSELQLSYTKRISRPTFNDLASYLLYLDPMSVASGNPSLKPTVTNNIKLGVSIHGYAFSILASRDENPIVLYQLNETPAQDLMYNNPQNMAYQNNLMFQTDIPVTFTKWWNMNVGFVGGLRQFRLLHTKDNIEKTYTALSINGRQSFTLPWNVSLEISGWYNSRQYDGSKKIDGFGMLNAGIKKDLINNWGSIQLSVTDLLKSMRVSGYFGTLTEEAFSLNAHFVYGAESYDDRIIRLTYSRTFGNSKQRSDRSGVSKDERDRIRKQ